MSSVLRKKSKKMQPAGYSKISLIQMRDNERRKNNSAALIEDSYKNVQLIAYQILHDKFGFGLKRVIRLENTINVYLDSMAKGEVTIDELEFFMEEKCNILVKNEANKVPFNERFVITKFKINPGSRQSAGMCILASIHNYFVLSGVALKTQFKFSTKQILDVYEWIRYYINTLSRYEQFELDMKMIAECLLDEIKYCDERFLTE